MLLMIDNYDSFTYNLVQYFGELGAQVEVHRNDQITLAQIEALRPERIVVSPGPCTPNEAGVSLAVIEHFAGKLPLLGVCLGIKVSVRPLAQRWCTPRPSCMVRPRWCIIIMSVFLKG